VDHVRERCCDLFESVCGTDLEESVAKLASGVHDPSATSSVKMKNKHCSQTDGRWSFFTERVNADAL
jgi:hypothetical protein